MKRPMHPAMIENQWKPGQSGNPAGRTKRPSFEVIVANILDEAIPGYDTTKREALARVFVDEMLKRNGAMIREFMAREWPVIQRHEVRTDGGMDIATLEAEIAAVVREGKNESSVNGSANGADGGGL